MSDQPTSPPAASLISRMLADLEVACPHCNYTISGLDSDICPECGKTITPDDIRFDARRRVFLELTRWRVPAWNALLLLFATTFLAPWGFAILIPYGLAIAAAWTLPHREHAGMIRKVQIRIWLACVWLPHALWLGLGGLALAMDWFYWNTYLLDNIGTMGDVLSNAPIPLLLAVLLALWLATIWLWRRELRRLARAAGIETNFNTMFPWNSLSTRLVTFLQGLVFIVTIIFSTATSLLDTLKPDWWLG